MNAVSEKRETANFPPAFHLECALGDSGEALTPRQLLSFELGRRVPDGAILAPGDPEFEAQALLASDEPVDLRTALDLIHQMVSHFALSTAEAAAKVQSFHEGKKGARASRVRAQEWHEAVHGIVRELLDQKPEVLRGSKESIAVAILDHPAMERFELSVETVRKHLSKTLTRRDLDKTG